MLSLEPDKPVCQLRVGIVKHRPRSRQVHGHERIQHSRGDAALGDEPAGRAAKAASK